MKTCCRCNEVKQEAEFHKIAKGRIGGRCKKCEAARIKKWAEKNRPAVRARHAAWCVEHPERTKVHSRRQYEKNKPRYNAHVMRRNARKLNATPLWAEKEKIAVVYKKAKEWGMHVDHIVPLKNPLVCGLHVWANLQLLSPRENMSKQNRSWPDMPEVL